VANKLECRDESVLRGWTERRERERALRTKKGRLGSAVRTPNGPTPVTNAFLTKLPENERIVAGIHFVTFTVQNGFTTKDGKPPEIGYVTGCAEAKRLIFSCSAL